MTNNYANGGVETLKYTTDLFKFNLSDKTQLVQKLLCDKHGTQCEVCKKTMVICSLTTESEVHCSLWLFEPRLGAPSVWYCVRAPPQLWKKLVSCCDFQKFSGVYLKLSTEVVTTQVFWNTSRDKKPLNEEHMISSLIKERGPLIVSTIYDNNYGKPYGK